MFLMLSAILELVALPYAQPVAALRLAHQLADQRHDLAAVWLYEQVAAARRPRTADFWMNLGKLHERTGNDLAALFAYRMTPTFAEFPPAGWQENLQTVRQALGQPSPEALPLFRRLQSALAPWARMGAWGLVISLVVGVSIVGPLFIFRQALPMRFREWPTRLIVAGFPLFVGFCLLMALSETVEVRQRARAWIIVKEPALLREGNGASYSAVRSDGKNGELRRGSEGWLLARRPNGWLRVELDDGRTGWLPEASVLLGP